MFPSAILFEIPGHAVETNGRWSSIWALRRLLPYADSRKSASASVCSEALLSESPHRLTKPGLHMAAPPADNEERRERNIATSLAESTRRRAFPLQTKIFSKLIGWCIVLPPCDNR